VDAGIGSAAANDDDLVSDDAAEGLFETVLDGSEARLELPAVEVGSVVGEDKHEIAHHGEVMV
jgi:hypothetical protein